MGLEQFNLTNGSSSADGFGLSDLASIASILVLFIVLVQWLAPTIAAKRRKRPFTVFFSTPAGGELRDCNQISVPLGELSLVELRLHPEVAVQISQIIFGFEGTRGETPEIIETSNSFVSRGTNKVQSPETTNDHYVDNKGRYHIKGSRDLAPPQVVALGFKVRPRTLGNFQVRLRLMTHEGVSMAKNPLYVRVFEPLPTEPA